VKQSKCTAIDGKPPLLQEFQLQANHIILISADEGKFQVCCLMILLTAKNDALSASQNNHFVQNYCLAFLTQIIHDT
jgi:hypothetical protein